MYKHPFASVMEVIKNWTLSEWKGLVFLKHAIYFCEKKKIINNIFVLIAHVLCVCACGYVVFTNEGLFAFVCLFL